jgi:tRNA-2-methylthio-N6-dimethylallyladenosine synthase
LRHSPIKAYVTITEGCDHFCSYCIVPYTRGRLRSRSMEEIVCEVEELTARGYREVTLLGQNVNAYAADNGGFPELLRRVAATGVSRVRFTSCHPQDITEELLKTIAERPNVCEQIHMAAQSGSDKVLHDMRRPYTKEEFLEKVELARWVIPGVNVTTDLIVGYPTETEEDFGETVDLVERARFGSAFIFKFSRRPGTIAAVKYGDPVPDEVKRRRHGELLELQRQISEEESRRLIGRRLEVLIEWHSGGKLYGRSPDHRTVVLGGEGHYLGEIVQVEVVGKVKGTLLGEASPSLER